MYLIIVGEAALPEHEVGAAGAGPGEAGEGDQREAGLQRGVRQGT